MKDTMSPRERVLTALAHQPTDRVPFSWGMGINLPARIKLAEYMGYHSLHDMNAYLLGLSDIRKVTADYCGPSYRNRVEKSGLQVDIWGVGRSAHNYGEGSYDEISQFPLAGITDISKLDSYEWPSPDWFDTKHLTDKIAQANQDRPYAIQIANGNIFESSWYMRGFEQTLMDLIIEPELIWDIMTRVTDFYIAYFKKMLDAADGMVDIVFTADDIGQQQGLLLSLDLWERMIKPHHRRLNKALHEYGVKILYHSDGAVMDAVPGLI
ncbi:MAG: uroporphyrinogen decarboxylase family protein, partial [Bacillota bacterium]|nr:uroporphyrinogen decarboxylase family protein [Bacillota bacterium]